MKLARLPFSRTPLNNQSLTLLARDVYDNLGRVQQQQLGSYVPITLVHARSPYTVKSTDWLVLCDCTAGAISLSFEAAGQREGFFVQVIKTDVSANAVTLSGTFNGVANPTLTKQYQARTINAGNGVYYFTPSVFPEDIPSGTFPGNYVIAGTLEVDGNFSVGNPTKFSVVASSGNTAIAGTLSVIGNTMIGALATGFTPTANTQLLVNATGSVAVQSVQVAPSNISNIAYAFSGSMTSPLATPNGRFIWLAGARGYDGSAFVSGDKARIALLATQAWTSTANGTQITFATTANGSTALTTRLTIDQDGTATFVNGVVLSSTLRLGVALDALGGGAAPTLGTIGGSGPTTAAQNSWQRMKDSTGADFWVPAWK